MGPTLGRLETEAGGGVEDEDELQKYILFFRLNL